MTGFAIELKTLCGVEKRVHGYTFGALLEKINYFLAFVSQHGHVRHYTLFSYGQVYIVALCMSSLYVC